MYLLDTNICIYAMKARYPLLNKKLLSIDPRQILISSVTVGELEYGIAKSDRPIENRHVIDLFLSAFEIISFSTSDARTFGCIRAELARKGTPIGPYDTMIAAQALCRSLTVVTHNTDEFSRVEGIKLEDWTIQALNP